LNYQWNRALGDNETGFRGTNDAPYRTEAWDFLIAGGALYNNLDYSFTVGHEDGSFVYPASQPGGGNPILRKQLRVLRDFLNEFEFIKMKPNDGCIHDRTQDRLSVRALVEPGKAYAIYLRLPAATARQGVSFELDLPPGAYQADWVDTKLGGVGKSERF